MNDNDLSREATPTHPATAPNGMKYHLSGSGNLMIHAADSSYHHATPEEFAAMGLTQWHEHKTAYIPPSTRRLAAECDRDAQEIEAQDAALLRHGYTPDEIDDMDRNGEL
jgi:hypothetical protein